MFIVQATVAMITITTHL